MVNRSPARLVGMVALFFVAILFLQDAGLVCGTTSKQWQDKPAQHAGFSIFNAIDEGGVVDVSIKCQNGQTDLPAALIKSQQSYSIGFDYDPTFSAPYVCQFGWVGGTGSQSFAVWTHNGTPYLSTCYQCWWKVENDGFYIMNSGDNVYYKLYSWIKDQSLTSETHK